MGAGTKTHGLFSAEDDAVIDREIEQRANGDSGGIGNKKRRASAKGEQRHKKQIAGDGNNSGSAVEGQQAKAKRCGRDRSSAAVGPGEMLMPEKIVKHGGFDGERRGNKRIG